MERLWLAWHAAGAHIATYGCAVDGTSVSLAAIVREGLDELRGIVWLGAAASLVPVALGARAAARLPARPR
jgi:hypothetical protein